MKHLQNWNGALNGRPKCVPGRHIKRSLRGVLTAGCLAMAAIGLAQYPGHLNNQVKAGPVLRSIAVLEWTGQPGKPAASRLIPVSVFEDGTYQDGGLYLARPEPLALQGGTEYQLMHSGQPEGIYDVATAQQLDGDWFGYGAWKPLPAPAPFHHLKPSKIDPEVVDGGSDRTPHFRKASPDADNGGSGTGAQPPDDPDRPTLRKRATPSAADADTNAAPSSNSDLETATAGGDPDRPRLTRGAHKEETTPAHLEGTPPNLEQMVAVSDAVTRDTHSFAYSWPSPEDQANMQAKLQTIAQQAIAKAIAAEKASATAKKPVLKTSASHAASGQSSTAQHGTTSHGATTAHRTTTPAKKPVAPAVTLTDVKFKAFELTYSGGATLVFSARTTEPDEKTHYVTVIAQPDIYGVPQVLLTQVTRAQDLDASPRLRLVDAVDAAADNRGELLFEQRGLTTRSFALYRVAAGRVDQMIATGPLPLGKGSAD